MCDHHETTESGLSRRTAITTLTAAGLGGLAALLGFTGCVAAPDRIVDQLPDVNLEEVPHGEVVWGTPPQAAPLPLPPPQQRIQTEIGEIMPRSAWTRSGPDFSRHVMPMNGVQLVTFHHSGDGRPFITDDPREVAQHLESVRFGHWKRGFNDIGYHFAIDHAGRVWQLRSLAYEGQHVRSSTDGHRWNPHNLGVVVLGDFLRQQPSPAQKQKIVAFGSYLIKNYKLPATAAKCHRELVDTDCPGTALYPYMVAIRRQGLI